MLHKLLFPKKHREIISLKAQVSSLQEELYLQMEVSKSRGEHLKDHPFLPEECLFKVETRLIEEKYVEVYYRDGFTISPDFGDLSIKDYPLNMWHILLPSGIKLYVKIESLYHAIVILQACGLDIDFKVLEQ